MARRRGSQLVEEGLLLAVALMALIMILSMISGFMHTLQKVYESSQNSLDKFLVEVLRDDLDAIWNATIGQITGITSG